MTWIPLLSVGVTLALAAVGGIVWLVRLEGRLNAISGRVDVVEIAAKAHEETKIEVVRLQEQIKHLTALIERLIDKPRRGASA